MNPFEPEKKEWREGAQGKKEKQNFSRHQMDHCDEILCTNEFFNAPDGGERACIIYEYI